MFLDHIRLTVVYLLNTTAVAPSCFVMITGARHAWMLGLHTVWVPFMRRPPMRPRVRFPPTLARSRRPRRDPAAARHYRRDAPHAAGLLPRPASWPVAAARPEHPSGVQPRLPGRPRRPPAASS